MALINAALVRSSGHKTSPRARGMLNQMFVPEAQFRDKSIVLFEQSIVLHIPIHTSLHPR